MTDGCVIEGRIPKLYSSQTRIFPIPILDPGPLRSASHRTRDACTSDPMMCTAGCRVRERVRAGNLP